MAFLAKMMQEGAISGSSQQDDTARCIHTRGRLSLMQRCRWAAYAGQPAHATARPPNIGPPHAEAAGTRVSLISALCRSAHALTVATAEYAWQQT